MGGFGKYVENTADDLNEDMENHDGCLNTEYKDKLTQLLGKLDVIIVEYSESNDEASCKRLFNDFAKECEYDPNYETIMKNSPCVGCRATYESLIFKVNMFIMGMDEMISEKPKNIRKSLRSEWEKVIKPICEIYINLMEDMQE